MTNAERNSFVFYRDFMELALLLPMLERGKLLTSMCFHSFIDGELMPEPMPKLTTAGRVTLTSICRTLDRDAEKYNKRVAANRENGKLGGRPKKSEESICCDTDVTRCAAEPADEVVREEISTALFDAEREVVEEDFEKFFEKYPKKKQKSDAYLEWLNLNPDSELARKIIAAVELHSYSDKWTREEGRFVPAPAHWLKSRGWETELTGEEIKAATRKREMKEYARAAEIRMRKSMEELDSFIEA